MKNLYKIIFLSLIFASGNIQAGFFQNMWTGLSVAIRPVKSYFSWPWPIFDRDLKAANNIFKREVNTQFKILLNFIKTKKGHLSQKLDKIRLDTDNLNIQIININSDLTRQSKLNEEKITKVHETIDNKHAVIRKKIDEISEKHAQELNGLARTMDEEFKKNEFEINKIKHYLNSQPEINEQIRMQHEKNLNQLQEKENVLLKNYDHLFKQSDQLRNTAGNINKQMQSVVERTTSLREVVNELNTKNLERIQFMDTAKSKLKQLGVIAQEWQKKNEVLEKGVQDIHNRLDNLLKQHSIENNVRKPSIEEID